MVEEAATGVKRHRRDALRAGVVAGCGRAGGTMPFRGVVAPGLTEIRGAIPPCGLKDVTPVFS